MNKKTYFFLSIIISTVFLSQEMIFLNNKNIFSLSKADGNAYVPYNSDSTTFSGHSFDFVENSREPDGDTVFYAQVIDNTTHDFYNYLDDAYNGNADLPNIEYVRNGTIINGNSALTFSPTLSNLKNDVYYFNLYTYKNVWYPWIFKNSMTTLALGGPDHPPTKTIYYQAINDNLSQSYYNYETPEGSIYPYIKLYDESNNNIFKITNLENNTLTFKIKAINWTESADPITAPEQNIGVTLINEDEEDPLLKYEQFEATLISESDNYFTYQIHNLSPNTNYTFFSINYTGLSIGNTTYNPQTSIELNNELEIPEDHLKIYTIPFVETTNGNSLEITKTSSTSIEFTLHVIETADKKFTNSLAANNNKMSVTLINLDNNKTIEKNASLLNISEKQNVDLFTFKIDGLSSRTKYEIYSFNDTGLAIEGTNDYAIDDEILVSEELGVTNNIFTTKFSIVFIIVLTLVLLIVFSIFVFLIYYLLKMNKKKTKRSKANDKKNL